MDYDAPKSLAHDNVIKERREHLHEPHIKPLTDFVDNIRKESGRGDDIPYFDPYDGGIDASCLFLFEDAGPKINTSGFISRNNDDDAEKNFLELNREAGLPRKLTASWCVVPWYIGDVDKIRKTEPEEIIEGKKYLKMLIPLFKQLEIIVLSGHEAQKVAHHIIEDFPSLQIINMQHPSPVNLNTDQDYRKNILDTLGVVVQLINK